MPTTSLTAAQAPLVRATGSLAAVRLQDVAPQVGLDFRQGAFRFGVSNDLPAMMGGGVCWLDYDRDGWLDLFVVNSFSNADRGRWEQQGGLPRSALFHNVRGSFVNVSKTSHADLAVRGEGCVAADFNGDGSTDLLITTASYDKLLWNNGDGTFTEGAKAAGIDSFGWHAGAAVADVNGDGRPDLFVAGYTDLNTPVPNALGGFPSNYQGVRDLLYLNEGNDSTDIRGSARSEYRQGSRRPSSDTGSVRCSPTTTATAGPISTSPTTKTRISSTRTFPGPAARPPTLQGSASASWSGARGGRRRSVRGDGHRLG